MGGRQGQTKTLSYAQNAVGIVLMPAALTSNSLALCCLPLTGFVLPGGLLFHRSLIHHCLLCCLCLLLSCLLFHNALHRSRLLTKQGGCRDRGFRCCGAIGIRADFGGKSVRNGRTAD